MKNQALQDYTHDGPTAFRFELAGNLDSESAPRLDPDRQTASSAIGDRGLIDMAFVTGVEKMGGALLKRWHQQGVRRIANSQLSRVLADSILGEPLRARAGISDRTWLPFRVSFLVRAATLLVLATIAFVKANAATIKPATVMAWNDYLRTAKASLQDRVRPGGSFLWTFENAERAAKVRGGEIIVDPVLAQNPKKVPGGLIHHWIGAAFVPNLQLDDILEVTRDYDHYKDFYRPSVVESKLIARNGSDDKFSMLLMNKAFFMKTALDADYETRNVRLDDHRFYSISKTTRVQEVEDYGQPGEHRKPEGEGSGCIWELYSIARLEQRDEGVYVEMEAIALSRDIPAAMHIIVDPIVRRVSRNSLLTSLQKTEEAARSNSVTVARSASVPAGAQQLRPAVSTQVH